MKKSRSVMAVTTEGNAKDYLECGLSKSYSASSNTLGIDLWRGRRCCSGNLLLPPLSQRQSGSARTPDRENISRPTTLPLLNLPSIAITTYQDRLREKRRKIEMFEDDGTSISISHYLCFSTVLKYNDYDLCSFNQIILLNVIQLNWLNCFKIMKIFFSCINRLCEPFKCLLIKIQLYINIILA
uniref:cAMP-specific 3',5'-cyclic phosphodiesterase 4B n=1 Tax=Anolis carolinensis TaxID=28377 RepID=A0A803SWI5_ANOCA